MNRTQRRATLWLAFGALGLLFGSACVSGSKIRADAEVVKRDISKARESGAYRCAPRDLALAESNVVFCEDELSQGNWLRAEEHVKVSIAAIKRALEDSKDCGPKKVLVKEPPKIVAIGRADRDKDGIPDDEDLCPDTPGPAEYKGCPDTDGDGIPDNLDKCPTDPEDKDGFQDEEGCPDFDNDQDGIPDGEDKCPNEQGTAENKGCPVQDTDGDGIFDHVDSCPTEPEDKDGFSDTEGCPDPDNDGDGIVDDDDKCPNEPGPPDSPQGKGCPRKYTLVKINRDKKQIEIKEKIYFAYSKWDILPKSFGLLNQVVQVLKDYPKMQISIEGHTDWDGSDAYNQMLSEKRAGSVKEYLISHGIEPERLQSAGYGESRPIASNRTARGKEANRRVEFRIVGE